MDIEKIDHQQNEKSSIKIYLDFVNKLLKACNKLMQKLASFIIRFNLMTNIKFEVIKLYFNKFPSPYNKHNSVSHHHSFKFNQWEYSYRIDCHL